MILATTPGMKRVLIVDDELLILYALSKALRSERTEVKPVLTGEAAISEISSCFYNVCFLDINLRGCNGLDVMRKIREMSRETRVVMMTGDQVDRDTAESIRGEAYDFITKPFDLLQVRRVAGMALDGNSNLHNERESESDGFTREIRRFKRTSFTKKVTYTVNSEESKPTIKADIVDVSEGGMCILTEYPHTVGHTLLFQDDAGCYAGEVRWVRGENDRFRVGIQFVRN